MLWDTLNNPLEQLRFPEDRKRVKKVKEVSQEEENLERLSKFAMKRMIVRREEEK